MIRWLPALITYSVIGLVQPWNARADDCSDLASAVEYILTIPEGERGEQLEWLRSLLVNDSRKSRILTLAIGHVLRGGSEGDVWTQCESF